MKTANYYGWTLLVWSTISTAGCVLAEEEKDGSGNSQPSVDLNPGAITFSGTVEDGMQTRTVTIQNNGDAPLLVDGLTLLVQTGSITIVEGAPADGVLRINPRTQAWMTVAWDPAGGDAVGAIQMHTNDPVKPGVQVELTGLVASANPSPDPETPVDGDKVDVYLLLDVAYNYSCYHPELDRFIDDIIDELYAHFGDVAVGFGVYDDYNYDGWATVGKAYEMRHAVSTDHDSVKEAAHRLQMEYGGTDEGSTYEAIYQAVWGAGFDQDCDGSYDGATDVRPWTARADDAFQGREAGLDAEFPAEGERRGVGWREGATHIVIYSVDNIIRDTTYGARVPESACGEPASAGLVAEALAVTDTRLLGINVYEWQASDPRPTQQMENLAMATGSYIDANDDGVYDEPAVLADGWNWPAMPVVVAAIEDLMRTSNH